MTDTLSVALYFFSYSVTISGYKFNCNVIQVTFGILGIIRIKFFLFKWNYNDIQVFGLK